VTSTIKILRPEDVWHPRIGAPLGNRNHLKHGRQTKECKAIRRAIAKWRRDTKALMARADREVALRELSGLQNVLDCHPRRGSRMRAERRGPRRCNTFALEAKKQPKLASSASSMRHDLGPLPSQRAQARRSPGMTSVERSPPVAHEASLVALPVTLLLGFPLVVKLFAARHAELAFGDALRREIDA